MARSRPCQHSRWLGKRQAARSPFYTVNLGSHTFGHNVHAQKISQQIIDLSAVKGSVDTGAAPTGRVVGLSIQMGRDHPSTPVSQGPVPGPAAPEAGLHSLSVPTDFLAAIQEQRMLGKAEACHPSVPERWDLFLSNAALIIQ